MGNSGFIGDQVYNHHEEKFRIFENPRDPPHGYVLRVIYGIKGKDYFIQDRTIEDLTAQHTSPQEALKMLSQHSGLEFDLRERGISAEELQIGLLHARLSGVEKILDSALTANLPK